MALAALIVSILSAVGSLAAVGASVWTHKQQGSRVRCRCGSAFPVYGSQLGEHQLSVTAVNEGRSPVTIEGWGFVFLDARGRPTDTTIVDMQPAPELPPLPYRLDGESSASWRMGRERVKATALEHGGPSARLMPFVRTGTGRMVFAESLQLAD